LGGLLKGGFLARRNRQDVKMSQRSDNQKSSFERLVRSMRSISGATRRHHSAEEKIRIVLRGDVALPSSAAGRHRREPVLLLVEGVP
jgi:hypothetical protein